MLRYALWQMKVQQTPQFKTLNQMLLKKNEEIKVCY
jgi:hypothetical protein